MATYTLIPSSLTGTADINNASNAYADTSSANYATCNCQNVQDYGGGVYLGGFDFSVIPTTEAVVSITCKIKYRIKATTTTTTFLSQIMSGVDGVALSSEKNISSSTASVSTYTLTEDVSTVLSYADTLCFHFYHRNALANYNTIYLYGAEIIVETVQKNYSKVVYDGDTLIDLTGDTATASDVASGKTFHLASGAQATGTLSLSKATATTTGSTNRTVSFTNLTKQPSWFMMICSSTNTTARNSRVQHMLYDGTTTTTYYTNSSTAGSIATSTSLGSFSYSSGTLTITVTSVYLGAADWELYYL